MGKTVLITGSTSGIGYAFSEKFAKKSYELVLVSRDLRKLETQRDQLNKYNIPIHIIQADLSILNAANEIHKSLTEKNICVDILVNNAGFMETGFFHETSMLNERDLINLNIVALTELTKLLLPNMIKNRYGRILNVSSIAAFIPTPLGAVYSASKAYVLYFTLSLQGELNGTGVSATALCPGPTKTNFAKRANVESTMLFSKAAMTADRVVSLSFEKLLKGKSVIIPGLFSKIFVYSTKIIPKSITNKISLMMMKNK